MYAYMMQLCGQHTILALSKLAACYNRCIKTLRFYTTWWHRFYFGLVCQVIILFCTTAIFMRLRTWMNSSTSRVDHVCVLFSWFEQINDDDNDDDDHHLFTQNRSSATRRDNRHLQPVVYWGVYAGIWRIPTSRVLLTAYTHLGDHK